MSVAANATVLKRRVDDYLWRDKSTTVSTLRAILTQHFWAFDRVAVVGGMVRDLARAGKRGFKSDIDLVIDAPAEEIRRLAVKLDAKPNRFGGFSYSTGRWKVDFWAMWTTWAYTEGHAALENLEDVTRCTFFDWDSVIYDLKSRRIFCDDGYLDRIRNGAIDVCLRPTPSVNGNLLRAVRRITLWDLEPGPKLRTFIDEHLTEDSFREIADVERVLYAHSIIIKFGSAERLRGHVWSRERRSELGTEYARQLVLPGFWHKAAVV